MNDANHQSGSEDQASFATHPVGEHRGAVGEATCEHENVEYADAWLIRSAHPKKSMRRAENESAPRARPKTPQSKPTHKETAPSRKASRTKLVFLDEFKETRDQLRETAVEDDERHHDFAKVRRRRFDAEKAEHES